MHWGVVTFQDNAAAQAAVDELNGKAIDGKVVQVRLGEDQKPRSKKDNPPSHTLYVANVYGRTKEDLSREFERCEGVKKVRKDQYSAFGHVKFTDVEAATKALKEMDGAEIAGEKIELHFAEVLPFSDRRRRRAKEWRARE